MGSLATYATHLTAYLAQFTHYASTPAFELILALLGGILPALFWLWFWLQEDKLHPEPRQRVALAFIGGMLAVPLVYPLEKLVAGHFGTTPTTLFLWATIEETAKLVAVWITALRSRDYSEPIDALEYLITTALGFAAIENALFIFDPILGGNAIGGLMTGNMRFMGASLLHVVSSAIIGYCIAREFYRGRVAQTVWRTIGLGLAIALHTVFNLFIMYENGSRTFVVFGFLWATVIGVLLLFEKIKKLNKLNT